MRKWVNGGGKLKVGGDVLVGLSRWETLVPKTKETDQLLKNMPEDDLWGRHVVLINIFIYTYILGAYDRYFCSVILDLDIPYYYAYRIKSSKGEYRVCVHSFDRIQSTSILLILVLEVMSGMLK